LNNAVGVLAIAEGVSPGLVLLPRIARFAKADMRAASPPCESTTVVIQAFSVSGGRRTLVMMPGTTSEKCLETKVEMRDDFPTPSVETRNRRSNRRSEKNMPRRMNTAMDNSI
jgi:hypothetical protein